MSLHVACPHCDSHLSLSTKPGEQVRCPMCHQVFLTPQMPAPAPMQGGQAPSGQMPGGQMPGGQMQGGPLPNHLHGGPMPGQGFQTGAGYGYHRPTSGLAIASMILGIVALAIFCVWFIAIPCGLIAIILGAMASSECSGQNARCEGGGMAIAGLVCGSVSIGLYVLVIAIAGMSLSPFRFGFW